MRLKICLLLSVVILATPAFAVTLNEIVRLDVSSSSNDANAEFIGSNPAVVAWNGRQLFIAGWNGSVDPKDIGIVEVTNPLSAGLVAATYGTPFGSLPANGSRGYTGLDIDQSTLAAAADTIAAAIREGIAAYDLDGSNRWNKSQRGGSGVGIDPGFGGDGAGVGHTAFGSGRRALQDITTGGDIYTSADGMIINGAGTGTFWRDMNFAPDGDIWLREGNNVIAGDRNGANSLASTTLVVDATEADFTPLQTIAYMSGTIAGDLVIYNDRPGAAPGQPFTDVVKVVQPDGTPKALSLNLLARVAEGSGAYDFSYDAEGQTLAISDFTNRNVHIFRVVPEPGSLVLTLLGLAGICCLGRRFR